MTQMYGYAIPISPGLDHTWAYTADGYCCACPDTYARGCTEEDRRNGRIVTQGAGNRIKGACMAGRVDTWMWIPMQCGVTYAINGVCHQMTNRILLATGDPRVNVILAAGTVLSYTNYGPWGTMVPPAAYVVNAVVATILAAKAVVEFAQRCVGCGLVSPVAYDPAALATIPITAEVGVSLGERQRMVLAEENYLHARQQLDEVFGGLAGRAPEDRLDRVKEIFAGYHRPNPDLVIGMAAEADSEPSPAELARRIDAANALAQEPLTEAANVLAESEFQAIFGHARDTQSMLIEPEILLAAAARPISRGKERPAPEAVL